MVVGRLGNFVAQMRRLCIHFLDLSEVKEKFQKYQWRIVLGTEIRFKNSAE